MGVLSDVFVGDRAGAPSVFEQGPSGILPTFQAIAIEALRHDKGLWVRWSV
jgi:hypothetical protein